uniref:Uncharacterized protein n=1 Tax=Anguilla anguilla TaxID=7936 RepID=A0A0E9TCM9_ANGAN
MQSGLSPQDHRICSRIKGKLPKPHSHIIWR